MNYVLFDTTMFDYVSTVSQNFISFDQHPMTFPNETEADTTKLFIETNFNYDALEVRPYNDTKEIQKVGS